MKGKKRRQSEKEGETRPMWKITKKHGDGGIKHTPSSAFRVDGERSYIDNHPLFFPCLVLCPLREDAVAPSRSFSRYPPTPTREI